MKSFFAVNIFSLILIWFIGLFQRLSFIGEILISVLPLLILISILVFVLMLYRTIKKKRLRKLFAFISSAVFAAAILPLIISVLLFYFIRPANYFTTDNLDSTLKIMSFNIYYGNTDMDSVAHTIIDKQPDVIMFYELTPTQRNILQPKIPEYLYALPSSPDNNSVLSKIPVDSMGMIGVDPSYNFAKVKVSKAGHSYVVYGIHPPALLSDYHMQVRRTYISDLLSDINYEKNKNVIIAGDFNMSPWVWAYQQFLNDSTVKFSDSGQGNGFFNTWSPSYNLDIPVTTIDHIWVSENVQYTNFETDWVNGSDHDALFVNVLAKP